MQVPFDLSISINPPSAHVSQLGLNLSFAYDVTFGRNGQARTIRMFLPTEDGSRPTEQAAYDSLIVTASFGCGEETAVCATLGLGKYEVAFGD